MSMRRSEKPICIHFLEKFDPHCVWQIKGNFTLFTSPPLAFYDAETVVSQKLVSFWKKNDD